MCERLECNAGTLADEVRDRHSELARLAQIAM
jgi:hypothetical protein